MRAALLKDYGQPLSVEEISEPIPGPGQVVINVFASGVCHSDLHLAAGEWERFKSIVSLPLVLGHEVAGRISALGPGVEDLCEGDSVGVPWFCYTCGDCIYCQRDMEVFCENSQITGVTTNGGLAEYMLAWASHTVPIPAELPLVQAAPLFCAGGTVYSALRKVKLNGSKLAVWGIGGLGQLAVQLGKLAGAHVTAVDSVNTKLAIAKDSGADEVVLAEEVEAWFNSFQRQPDVALVCANSVKAYTGALNCLRKEGTLLVVALPEGSLSWGAADLVRSGAKVIPSRVVSRQEMRELLDLAVEGKVRSQIEEISLEDINHIFGRLQRGQVEGRAVINFENR